MIERAAEQRREPGRRRHAIMISASARPSASPENRSRAMARDSTKGAGARGLDHPAGQQVGNGGEGAEDAAGKEHRKAPSVPASGGHSGPKSARPRAGRPPMGPGRW